MDELGREWRAEFPTRLHTRQLDEGGCPEYSPEFAAFLNRSDRNPKSLDRRTTRAFRRLRRISQREYEVAYRALLMGENVAGTTAWLNERAVRNNIPLPPGRQQHYVEKDVIAILMAGVSWVHRHF